MNKRIIFLSLLLTLPFFASAQAGGLVNCGKTNPDDCNYDKLIQLIQNLLNFVIYVIATPIATILIALSGFKMVTSGGDQKSYDNAKKVLKNVMIGYVVMLSAFIIIKLFIDFLFGEEFSLLG